MEKHLATILFLMIALSACMGPEDTFDFRETDMRYYELVHEDATCRETCLTEYIIYSNGLVFLKKETMENEARETEIELGTIGGDRAEDLIQKTEEFIGDSNTRGVDCRECRLYHVFYGGRGETRSVTEYIEDAPGYIKELESETQDAVEDLNPEDSFFLHLIFKKPGQYAVDYHFNPDGTVLREEFGQRNGELISSQIYSLDPEEVRKLRDSITGEYFTSNSSLENCHINNLEWGYLEIKKDSDYRLVYTCGTGYSAADMLFKELFEKTGGR
jgi:hypothetical protein